MLVMLLGLAGCRNNSVSVHPAKAEGAKLGLTKAERIAQVTGILTKYNKLPWYIVDAYFDEQTVGGTDPSGLGPVYYVSYM